jgi:hypothetical protein
VQSVLDPDQNPDPDPLVSGMDQQIWIWTADPDPAIFVIDLQDAKKTI